MSKEYTPLVVAKSFTKLYYEKIHKSPQQLYRFYKDESNFFHGDDSQQGSESVTGSDNIRAVIEELNLAGAVVDLTDGSIDAQCSDNNAVFLVVTGKITMSGKEARPFVQSFFLVCQNTRKNDGQLSYYVRNSVFRLLGEDTLSKSVAAPTPPVMVTTAVFKEEVIQPVKEIVPDKVTPAVIITTVDAPQLTSESDEGISSDVVDTKNDELDASTVTSEPEYVNVSVKTDSLPVPSPVVALEVAKEEATVVVQEKAKPITWACLFTGPDTAVELKQPQQQEALKPKKVAPKREEAAKTVKTAVAGDKPLPPPQTLYLCQLPEEVVEIEIRAIFEPFGTINKVDINSQKGFAFVDFAEASSVKSAIAKKGTGCFTIRDVALQVEERQTKRSTGGSGAGRDRDGRSGGKSGAGNRDRNGGQNKDKTGTKSYIRTGNRDNRNRTDRISGAKTNGNKQAAK